MSVLRPLVIIVTLVAALTGVTTSHGAAAAAAAAPSGLAATVAGTPITRAAYQRRLRLLYALPLMNDPMRVPVPPTDTAIDQLVAERVIVVEGGRRRIVPTPADLARARVLQQQEYTTVGGLAALERRGLISPAEARAEVRVTALSFALGRRLGAAWYTQALATDHVVYYVGSGAIDAPAPVVGHPAPDIAVRTLDDRSTSIGALRGHPTILNVWATWCRYCGRELPLIAAFAAAHPSVQVVALEEYGTPALVRAYLRAHPAHPPVLYDGPGRLSQVYGIDLLPTTLALDAGGRIRLIIRGYLQGTADLARLLRAAAA
ncbi:MAG: redoxin domain-containing protein [Chloroflexota bacterium]|nr:redoxin domain-containing protein [Chloroflexota bacterium]